MAPREPKRLGIYAFGDGDPLDNLESTDQTRYLQDYLADLDVASVLEEPYYFDLDFFDDFCSFYGRSIRGYSNVCSRLHFFTGALDRVTLEAAVGGSSEVLKRLQHEYRGFTVVRPIPIAPLGRTVVSWYEDLRPGTPRVDEPSREYETHVAGLTFTVTGLAWQQQDSAVGSCATVALWSCLHSSALDDRHSIPSPAEITKAAHRTAPWGARVFPSEGLNIFQILEAIKECGLAPMLLEGDLSWHDEETKEQKNGFTISGFASSCAALLRSGYPVLIDVEVLGGSGPGHLVCAVAFREEPSVDADPGTWNLADDHTRYIYIHDDNIGPNARFEILADSEISVEVGEEKYSPAVLKRAPPSRAKSHATSKSAPYPSLRPRALLAAADDYIRTTIIALQTVARKTAMELALDLADATDENPGLTVSSRFITLPTYLSEELTRTLGHDSDLLARTRLSLIEQVPPMSLHLGLVRLGIGPQPILDVLYDTTDSNRALSAFCHVAYEEILPIFIQEAAPPLSLGILIAAY